MDRPSSSKIWKVSVPVDANCVLPVIRSRKAVNYSVFQDDDDEDFTCVKPPPKKARTAERNHKTTSASPNEVVILTSQGSRKRASLDDKLYDRDLETALTLSLLSSPRTQDGEPTTKTDDCDVSQPNQCSPPVLIHCSSDASHIVDDSRPHPDLPPVLSNCCIDGRSLGLNLISLDASPTNLSKQTDASKEQKKRLKEKDNKVDEDYQPQNTPDSESDADFTEEDESEDETFTVKKIKVVKLKTEKNAPPPVKDKKEKKDKKPAKAPNASKAKTSAPSPVICRSPAAPVSGLKKSPNTPPISKPALCSSPAGGKLPKWNPPGLVGRSPGASQNAPMKSPGQGLRLGLSRRAPIKPLHQNAAVI